MSHITLLLQCKDQTIWGIKLSASIALRLFNVTVAEHERNKGSVLNFKNSLFIHVLHLLLTFMCP